ncbi:MAG: DNA polymerase IV [Bacteroidia bacterium]|jgi:DNA polymerase-4|nr:DNA polymerase IV [Bacteroidia bacterium]
MPDRKIIHIDMDAFYASVEQRDAPELRGQPVIVGWPHGRSVVLTASYEARKFGVRSAMPGSEAYRLCPQGVFVPPRFPVYKEVSQQIRAIFHTHTDLVEPLSLDEAYLDVTADKQGIGSAIEIAKAIKAAIKEQTGLTASAGVSVNKFVAKVASGMQKPDGLTFIGPSRIEAFMEQLPVGEFFGVGKVTAAKMKAMGLHTGADLKQLSEDQLVKHFGKTGRFYYRIVRGIDNRPVEPDRETKSVSVEDTFAEDVLDMNVLTQELASLAEKLTGRLERYDLAGRTVTVKVKYHDFKQVTRSKTLAAPPDKDELLQTAIELLQLTEAGQKRVRLIGIGVAGFGDFGPDQQLKLF